MENKYQKVFVTKDLHEVLLAGGIPAGFAFQTKPSDEDTFEAIDIQALKDAEEKISELTERIRFLQTKLVGY